LLSRSAITLGIKLNENSHVGYSQTVNDKSSSAVVDTVLTTSDAS